MTSAARAPSRACYTSEERVHDQWLEVMSAGQLAVGVGYLGWSRRAGARTVAAATDRIGFSGAFRLGAEPACGWSARSICRADAGSFFVRLVGGFASLRV